MIDIAYSPEDRFMTSAVSVISTVINIRPACKLDPLNALMEYWILTNSSRHEILDTVKYVDGYDKYHGISRYWFYN